MNRRALLNLVTGIASLAGACRPALGQGKGRGRGKGRGDGEDGQSHHSEAKPGPGSSSFRREDYATIQRYYAGPRDLPPGLRRKYARTGQLPPGWEKKMQPFPPELVRVLPPPPPNIERGFIDGVAVTYDRKTRVILDSIDLIAAIAGR